MRGAHNCFALLVHCTKVFYREVRRRPIFMAKTEKKRKSFGEGAKAGREIVVGSSSGTDN